MTRRLLLLFIATFSLTACAGVATAKGRKGTETRTLRWIDSHRGEELAFLEKVVNINSGTMNPAGVRAVGEVYRKAFEELGMETEWVELPAEMHRAGHLIAVSKGKGNKRLLLIGHLDTVFEKDSPFQRYQAKGNMASGPGTIDMKGGNTVILFALRALKSAGVLDDLAVTVVLNGDEEKPGSPISTTRAPLIEAAKESQVALCFESLVDNLDTATIARRGFVGWLLKVEGKRGHSSQVFSNEFGDGAIFEAARILEAFRVALEKEPNLTFSPGRILGGTTITHDLEHASGTVMGKRNVIPQIVEVSGDLRALSPEQVAKTKEVMRAIVDAHLPETTATLSFEEGYPPMAPTRDNQRILAILSRINQDIGRGPIEAVPPMRRGAADISFVAPLIPSMDGLGLLGTGDHSPAEIADLRSVDIATKRAALLIYRIGSMAVDAPL